MKKIMILLLCVLLGGCRAAAPSQPEQMKVVTRITAQYNSGAVRLQRSYTDEEKLRSILNYLRGLSPYGSGEEEPAGQAGQAEVTLYFSDGSSKVYEQYGVGFLRLDGGKWQRINPERGQELPLILGLLESDEKF